jgi:tRNA pseudouridine38-40 synthase
MRYFITLSYNGTNYRGWQIQNNVTTIQGILNEALSTILRSDIASIGSGRTDAGVHAEMQMVHFDFEHLEDIQQLINKLNGLLPKDISVHTIRRVTEEANSRFDAQSRAYIYRIHQHKDPFKENLSYLYTRPLDLVKMNQCCELIKSWKDFESMSKVKTEVNNFNCQIFLAKWEKHNEEINFSVSANRFLRGMVRALVGTMVAAGENIITINDFEEILKSKDRRKAGRSVPAHGLYLRDITYPKHIFLD